MASDIHFTPAAPVRWCHLIQARTQLDESKPKAWTCELVLDNNDAKHKAFLAKLDQIFTETHGTKKKRSDKGQPWKPDKDDATKTVVRFKALEFIREDGSKATGPQIIDAKRQAWDGSQIGNGSELIIKFSTYGWERPEGTGLSLQPKAAQVLTFVAREEQDSTDGFEEQDGYSVTQSIGFVDEFAEDEELF